MLHHSIYYMNHTATMVISGEGFINGKLPMIESNAYT